MIARIESVAADLENKRKIQWLLLAGVTALALFLRFFRLGTWSFWIDELYTIGRIQAHYSTLDTALHNIPPHTNWVPVSLLFTAGFLQTLGISEWTARLAPALIGVLSIPVLYIPIKRLFNARIALIAALLLAVSPWHLSWSQNARFYTALMLFYTLALLAIYDGLERDRPIYIVLGLLFFYLAMSERIFALLLAPVIGAYVILLWIFPFAKPPGFNRKNLAILSLPILAGLLIEGGSRLATGTSRFFGDFGWFFLYVNNTPQRLLGTTVLSIGLVLMTMALFGAFFALREKSRAALLLTISAVLPILLLLPLSTFMFTQDRYLFITLPSWIILAAVMVHTVWKSVRQPRILLVIAILFLLLAAAVQEDLLYFTAYDGNRRDWRAAFTFIREQAADADAVVAFWPEFGPYYLDREIIAWDDIDVEGIKALDRRVWFVVDSETVWGDVRKKAWIEKNAELKEVFYLRTPEDKSIRLYLYDPAPT